MSDLFIFIWGLLATVLAVGPLTIAWYLDSKDKDKQEKE